MSHVGTYALQEMKLELVQREIGVMCSKARVP